ncbi:MAG TPA: putative sporulation protein YtxC [Bacilli bacterium]
MELFAVSVGEAKISAQDLLARLESAMRNLRIPQMQENWICTRHNGFLRIACHADMIRKHYIALKSRICRAAAEAVADSIVRDVEPAMILQIINKSYHFEDPQDLTKVESFCRSLLEGNESDLAPAEAKRCFARKGKIADEVFGWLQDYAELNLDGLVHFRLNAYKEELREVVEYAIEEFLMEKQYQEFISLLKYFVLIQDAKIPAAHLMHRGDNDFILLNEQMERIESGHISGFVPELADKDINYEDMIVSTLISVAPQQIYIHTREPEKQVIKTIQQIFENRTRLCTYCSACKPILGKKRKNRSLP